ncbi:hypothetical protein GWP40_03685 [Treponema vincentii]|nr:hypothetical protein GWP40_03685 [Treponema vincentii]
MNAYKQAIRELKNVHYFLKRHSSNHDIYFNAEKSRSIPLQRHYFDEDDLRYKKRNYERR